MESERVNLDATEQEAMDAANKAATDFVTIAKGQIKGGRYLNTACDRIEEALMWIHRGIVVQAFMKQQPAIEEGQSNESSDNRNQEKSVV